MARPRCIRIDAYFTNIIAMVSTAITMPSISVIFCSLASLLTALLRAVLKEAVSLPNALPRPLLLVFCISTETTGEYQHYVKNYV